MDNQGSLRCDRVSGLPKDVLHHILSFLDMKQVIEFSILSKQWKHLWLSVPVLNFVQDVFAGPYCMHKFRLRIQEVLIRRLESSIHKLCISVEIFTNNFIYDSLYLPLWVTSAIRNNIHVLHLEHAYFASHLLASVAQLNTLHLVSVIVPGTLTEGVLLKSYVLENMILEDCRLECANRLTISSPRLKYLKVQNSTFRSNHQVALEILAPNLTSLVFKGFMYKDYVLEDLYALTTVEIEASMWLPHCLEKILKAVHHANSLILSKFCFQNYHEVGRSSSTIGGVLNFCQNVKHLKLTYWESHAYIHPLAKLLESFPRLESLSLEKLEAMLIADNSQLEGDILLEPKGDEGEWRNHLKFVEIQNLVGCKSEAKLLKFFLNNTMGLEKIIITSTEKKELYDFWVTIGTLLSSSSMVKLMVNSKDGGKLVISFCSPW